MLLGGLQKTTLIDFPGRVACTVFTVGCNFRCPFCHNKDLVSLRNFRNKGLKELSEQFFLEFLEKRRKILDGVVITGGEPTVQKDLPEFCQKIKNLSARDGSASGRGLEVKLDTNGSNPEMLEELIKKQLVDFVAMDVKTAFDEYQRAVNIKYPRQKAGRQISKIKNSIKLILQSDLEYELRTTVVPKIHNKKIMIKLARQLKSLNTKYSIANTDINWILQQFRPKNCLNKDYLKIKPFTNQELKAILKSVKTVLPKTKLRGSS